MNIEFQIDITQFINFHKKYIMNSEIMKNNHKKRLVPLLIFLIACIIVSFSFMIRLILVSYLIIFILFLNKLISFTLNKKLHKLFKSDIYKNTFNLTKLELSDEGIKTETSYAIKKFSWKLLYDISLTEEYFIIRTLSDEIIYIPSELLNIDKLNQLLDSSSILIRKEYPTDIKYRSYFI